MKSQLLEFMLCGTIATYCMVRCIKLMPDIIILAHKAVAAATVRAENYQKLIDQKEINNDETIISIK